MQLETVTSATYFSLVPWVVFFPLIGLLINLVIGKKAGRESSWNHCQPGIRACFCSCLPAAAFPPRPILKHISTILPIGSTSAASQSTGTSGWIRFR